ncbi:MAG: TrkH family potassium uptake protein, partial [Acidimicrobiia bacterium]
MTEQRPPLRRPGKVAESNGSMGRRLAYVIGAAVTGIGAAMLIAVAFALMYQEWEVAAQIALASLITALAGLFAWRVLGAKGELTLRDGFATVGLSWFVMAAFGTLPYLFTGSISNLTNAFFETAAGFTTTGSSVVPDPSLLPHGILIWRSLTQWLGGMGVLVLAVAVLPLLGVGGVQLVRAESPGPQPDRLTPRFRETAKRLWLLYLGFTVAQAVLLVLGDMTPFEAIAHSFTTMSTGGFSTDAGSIGAFSAYTQWIVIIFMLLAGISFTLHFRALRKPLEYPRSTEFRLYGAIVLAATVIIVGGIWATGAFADVAREGAFTAVSIVTTTGYATANFGEWVSGLQIFVVGLMFLGGMTGSTAGSVKTFRIGVLTKAAATELRRYIHPRAVFVVRFGDDTVDDAIVESAQSFFLFYMFLFMTGTFLMGFIESSLGAGLDLVTSASSVASALGNIGPGLGDVGPAGSYLGIP